MLQKYHIEILQQALGDRFSPSALEKIIQANVYQDRISAQFGHDEYHFDNNTFEKSYAYIEEQRALTITSLHKEDTLSAWSAFGRLAHTAQDFYAHSNYIDLWLSRHANETHPDPSEINPADPQLIGSPDLRSGKLYYPLELLSYIKFFRPLVLPRLPRDSHAWMNIDSPEQGFKFVYVMQASIKRTAIEFERTKSKIPMDLINVFLDK